jgi:hypothetical protein
MSASQFVVLINLAQAISACRAPEHLGQWESADLSLVFRSSFQCLLGLFAFLLMSAIPLRVWLAVLKPNVLPLPAVRQRLMCH